MTEAVGYVLSLPAVSTAIIGCQTPAEVDANAEIARKFAPLPPESMRALEARTQARAAAFSYFKK